MEIFLSQLMWSLLGLLAVLQAILPIQILSSLISFIAMTFHDYFFTDYAYFEIPEFNGCWGVEINDLYRHVTLYINSINNPSPTSCRGRLTLSTSRSSGAIAFAVAPNHAVHDRFQGHLLSWTHHVQHVQDYAHEKRSFTLKLPKRHRTAILSAYFDHITTRAEQFERLSRQRRLFTNNGDSSRWSSVPFRHPSTFQTLALEPEMKKQLLDDLESFSEGKEFYKRVGRAWKRGYLLYGPPGSGKSSLIAATANFLSYDVYDLELSNVLDNSELRALLMQTTNRSIIVIEDIDCSIDLNGTDGLASATREILMDTNARCSDITVGDGHGDENDGRVTLSGLLNFSDGLWSCCGEERIIIFTTNRKENVDQALFRSGRVDVQVSLGTCGMRAFKALVKSYLGLDWHVCFNDVESCIRSGGGLAPARIGEILLRNRRDADVAVKAVVSAMRTKILGADSDCGDDLSGAPESPDCLKQWEVSLEECGLGSKSKSNEYAWERRVNLLVRLKSFDQF